MGFDQKRLVSLCHSKFAHTVEQHRLADTAQPYHEHALFAAACFDAGQQYFD